jgi:hypothetical protein
MTPDYQATIDFLRKWEPSGPWVLVAIPVERGAGTLIGGTFTPDTEAACREWLELHGQSMNLYFHVNIVGPFKGPKASAADVTYLRALHTDIDPRDPKTTYTTAEKRTWLEAERERIREEVLPGPPTEPPTVVIDSGGGYQLFWKLEAPVPVEPGHDLYNKKLAELFDADSVHNLDRVMRLPGTLNRPDKQKRNRGRTIALATLVEFHEDRVYTLEQFEKSTEKPKPRQGAGGGVYVPDPELEAVGGRRTTDGAIEFELPEEPPRFETVDDLGENVPDYTKMVIVQGNDPDNPDKWPSRSEALFYVCCELWRAGKTATDIFAIITDPGWGIAESVVEKRDSSAYAHRQLVSAWEQTRDPDLAEFNRKYAVIQDIGGKCRVVREVEDPILGRSRLSKQSFGDFQNAWLNRRKQVGEKRDGAPVYMPIGKWWLHHPHRRQFDRIDFLPGYDIPGVYNLWRGFAVQPRAGDCSLYLAHMKDNICQGKNELYDYLIGWMALAVQQPSSQGHTAIVLRGKQGTGKGVFVKGFGFIFGRHFLQVSNVKYLTGNFNAHLRDCAVVFADEAFYAGDKKHEGVLKALITEENFTIEAKGIDVEVASNYTHLLLASNEEWVVPANVDDRRFFVIDVADTHKQDTSYFLAIVNQLENGGRAALLHMLLEYDISKFDVRKVPQTSALRDQKEHSYNPREAWWHGKLVDGLLFQNDEAWRTEVQVSDIRHDYSDYMFRRRNGENYNPGMFLRKALPAGFPRLFRKSETEEVWLDDGSRGMCRRPRYYLLPTLEECRAWWDKHFGGPHEWPKLEPVHEGVQTDDDGPF